jgi:glycosyltransferase involved in cell wall biosynthesis
MDLSIIIPTFRRPAELNRCIETCLTQTGLKGFAYELVIVDNCPQASALEVVAKIPQGMSASVRYIHELRSGVVHARNRGVIESQGPLVAFIDDDEIAAPSWISSLVDAQLKYDADVVFGPVLAIIETWSSADPDLVREFFTIDCAQPSGPITGLAHTGNVLLRRESCFKGGRAFNPQLGFVGGEDTLFFLQLARDGASMVWCHEAIVYEMIPPRRTTYSYIFKRSIVRGQVVPRIRLLMDPPERRAVVWFMMTGTLQFFYFGLASIVAAPISRNGCAKSATRALMGLGKAFWMPPFRIGNYYGPSGTA